MSAPFSRPKFSLLTKALLGTSALVAAVVASLSGLFLLRHQEAFQRQVELRAEVLASSLAGQSQFDLLLKNQDGLARMARTALASTGDVVYVAVEDVTGKVLASAEKAPASPGSLPAGTSDFAHALVRHLRIGQARTECIEASVPVIPDAAGGLFGPQAAPPETLGRIRVAMSLESQRVLFLDTLRQVLLIALGILLTAFVIDFFQIRRLLRPLADLVGVARAFGQGRGGDVRAVKGSDDEIGVLVDSFNEMLDQVAERTRELHEQIEAKERARAELAAAQQRLIDLSRQSGMAEIATSVLHNVGNVLNSVNVSAALVAGRIKDSRVDKLRALAEMLQQQGADLAGFLRSDPKGQRVIPYLDKLAAHLQQERDSLVAELELLTGHIDHIKQIVSTQQQYAKVSGLSEELVLPGLVDDALRLLQPGMDRHRVSVVREYDEIPLILSDKHQILQVLLNLLRNAKQAIADSGRSEGVVRVRIRRCGEEAVRLEIKDSGVGLAAENLTRIFAHGFTTKANGHGFGLHSCALTARQLGGALHAASEGLGHGATFTLELPIARKAVPQAG